MTLNSCLGSIQEAEDSRGAEAVRVRESQKAQKSEDRKQFHSN